jgi:hypothetical protein
LWKVVTPFLKEKTKKKVKMLAASKIEAEAGALLGREMTSWLMAEMAENKGEVHFCGCLWCSRSAAGVGAWHACVVVSAVAAFGVRGVLELSMRDVISTVAKFMVDVVGVGAQHACDVISDTNCKPLMLGLELSMRVTSSVIPIASLSCVP